MVWHGALPRGAHVRNNNHNTPRYNGPPPRQPHNSATPGVWHGRKSPKALHRNGVRRDAAHDRLLVGWKNEATEASSGVERHEA